MLVDDIETNLQVAVGLLSPYRVETDPCLGGAEALALVQKQEYDMILMDHMMPEMDGMEATKRIRALGGGFEKLTIIALTANAVSGMREKFLSSGFSDYLAKPVELPKLNEIVEKWIPENKRVKITESAAKRDIPPSSVDLPIEIDGLDTARGIALTGGTEEGYVELLEIYCRDVTERLEFLREFEGRIKSSFPDESALSLFVIQVHALKSASASIGASEISKNSAALEAAGKNRDMETLKSGLGAFCDALASLTGRIEKAISADSRNESGAAVNFQ